MTVAEEAIPASTGRVPAIERALRAEAAEWLGATCDDPGLELLDRRERRHSALYHYAITCDDRRLGVYVKVPSLRADAVQHTRPYSLPETESGEKYRMYYEAFRAIEAELEANGDPMLRIVSALAIVPDAEAVVMGEVEGRTLRALLPSQSRLRALAGAEPLDEVLSTVGRWLSVFHGLRYGETMPVVNREPGDLPRLVDDFARYLAGQIGDSRFFADLVDDVRELAEQVLPERLPLGLRFGDFGLTNVLIGEGGVVTGIDTLANWRAPLYEDIAYFLTGVKAFRPQVTSQGLAFGRERLARLEEAFLAGYFGGSVLPRGPLALYQVLKLVERWAAKADRSSRRTPLAGTAGAALVNRFCRRELRRLVAEARSTV